MTAPKKSFSLQVQVLGLSHSLSPKVSHQETDLPFCFLLRWENWEEGMDHMKNHSMSHVT